MMSYFSILFAVSISTAHAMPPHHSCPTRPELLRSAFSAKASFRSQFLESPKIESLKNSAPGLFASLPGELEPIAKEGSWLAKHPSLVWLPESIEEETRWIKANFKEAGIDPYQAHVTFMEGQLEVLQDYVKNEKDLKSMFESVQRFSQHAIQGLKEAAGDKEKFWALASNYQTKLKAMVGLPELSDFDFKFTTKPFGPVLNKPARSLHERMLYEIPKGFDRETRNLARFRREYPTLSYQLFQRSQTDARASAEIMKSWLETKEFDAMILDQRQISVTMIKSRSAPLTLEEFESRVGPNGVAKKSISDQLNELLELRKMTGIFHFTQQLHFDVSFYCNQPLEESLKQALRIKGVKVIDPVLYSNRPL